MESYTQEFSNYILDLPDREIAAIWEDIESMPLDTTAELWRRKLQKIARDHTFSSRFALMRILCSRANNLPIFRPAETEVPADAAGFEMSVDGKLYRFRDISLEHAENLTPEEHLDYIACLTDLASRQADSDPAVSEQIIARAWYDTDSANAVSESLLPESVTSDKKLLKKTLAELSKENKARYKTRLTREEALLLGHVLGFTLGEIQWFLLRVLQESEGFRFQLSQDLIEAYGFLTSAGWQKVRSLHQRYKALSANIPKADSPERNDQWTRNVSDTLPGKVEQWMRFPETQDENFMEWLLALTPGLDVPSRTGQRIYRNLVAFAYDLITGQETVPSDLEFADCIRDVYQEPGESGAAHRLLYENGTISSAHCKIVADALMLENQFQSASIQEDKAKAWHILTQRNDGSLSTAGGIVNTSRSRIMDILTGKANLEKGDLLYLFWFIANHIWMQGDELTDEIRCYRLMDFLELSGELLEAAMLPAFYPPHIMEQSMLLSIACGGRLEGDDASVVYEYMLQSTILSRNRTKKA
jgi:hypothetical protein